MTTTDREALEIARWFLDHVVKPGKLTDNWLGSWFLDPPKSRTYISGAVQIIDFDYRVSYLLEVGQQLDDVTYMSFLAVLIDMGSTDAVWYPARQRPSFHPSAWRHTWAAQRWHLELTENAWRPPE